MKLLLGVSRTVGLSIGIFFASAAGFTQGQKAGVQNDSIDICGVSVRIGESGDAVLSKIDSAGRCKPIGGSKSGYSLQAAYGPATNYGDLRFSDGKVSSVVKNWDLNVANEYDYSAALVALLAHLEKEGSGNCKLKDISQMQPEFEARALDIDCGIKHVYIGAFKTSRTKNIQLAEVLQVRK